MPLLFRKYLNFLLLRTATPGWFINSYFIHALALGTCRRDRLWLDLFVGAESSFLELLAKVGSDVNVSGFVVGWWYFSQVFQAAFLVSFLSILQVFFPYVGWSGLYEALFVRFAVLISKALLLQEVCTWRTCKCGRLHHFRYFPTLKEERVVEDLVKARSLGGVAVKNVND